MWEVSLKCVVLLFVRRSGRAEAGPLLGSAAAGASAPPDAAALPDGPGAAPAAGRAAAHPQDRAEVRLFWRSGRKTARGAEQQSKALAQLGEKRTALKYNRNGQFQQLFGET